MKALVLRDYMRVEYADAPAPVPGPEEILIRVRACGICGSDIHGMDGSTGRRRPPIIMGHEAAGEIVAVGAEVAEWEPGDRVTFDSTIYCGKCRYCEADEVNLCEDRRVLGVSCEDYRRDGAFAELVAVPARVLFPLPPNLSFEHAAMAEPVAIALHAVNRSGVGVDETAVVFGTGMIGLLIIQALRIAGCARIVAVDVDEARLAMAQQMGATDAVLSGSETVQEIAGILPEGADHCFEVVGIGPTVDAALRVVRKGGALTLVGNLSPRIDFPLQLAVTREITLHGSCASCGEYPAALALIAQREIDVAPLISVCAPLREGAEWFDRLYHKEPGLMKVILIP